MKIAFGILVITAFYVTACMIAGLIIIKIFFNQNIAEKRFYFFPILVSGFLLGEGILANIWLILGLIHFFKSVVIWIVLILVTIAGSYFCRELYKNIYKEILKFIKINWEISITWKILAGFTIVLILFFGLGAVSLPPAGDAEAFYMVLPKIIASAERLLPQNNYYEFTQNGLSGEMHFAALFSIGNAQCAKFFVWFNAIALMTLLLYFSYECGLRAKGLIIVTILLFTSSTFTYYITDGKVDIFGAAFGIAAIYWACEIDDRRHMLPIVLTGIFSGFAAVAKFSNIPTVIPGIIVLVILNVVLKSKKNKGDIKDQIYSVIFVAVVSGALLLLTLGPHLIKNGLLFGEPFAPFVFLKSEGADWTNQVWYSKETTKFIIMTYPIAITLGQYPAQAGNLSVLVIAYMPFVIFLYNFKKILTDKLFQVSIVAIFCIIIWIFLYPSTMAPRYFLGILLLLIPLAARSAENIIDSEWPLGITKKIIYSGLFLFLFIFLTSNLHMPFAFSIGNYDHSPFSSEYFKSCKFINSIAAPGERIYFRGYYAYFLRPDLLQVMCDNNDFVFEKRKVEFGTKWEYLYDRGFKYIMVQKSSHMAIFDIYNVNYKPPWIDIQKIYDDDSTIILSVKSRDKYRTPSFGGRQIHHPAWDVVKLINRNPVN